MTPAGDRVLGQLVGEPDELELARDSCRVLPPDMRVRGAFVIFAWHAAKRLASPGAFDDVAHLIEACMPSFFGMSSLGDGVALTQLIGQRTYPGRPIVESSNMLVSTMAIEHAREPVFQAIAKVAENSYYEYLRCFTDMAALIWTGETGIALEDRNNGAVFFEYPVAGAAGYFTPGFMRGMLHVFDADGAVDLVRHDLDDCRIEAQWQQDGR